MFGIYEAGERGLMKGLIEIKQSSSHVNKKLIQDNLTIK
jgi:hypothetical protein